MRLCRWGAVAVLVLAATGCGTPTQRLAAVQENARRNQPLVEWVLVRPEHLANVDMSRLKAEGAALVVIRSLREAPDGAPLGSSGGVALRNVSTSTARLGSMARAGNESEIGWGVMIVPPGQYALHRGRLKQIVRTTPAGVRTWTIEDNGHPYVPLSATTRIGPGEVVYVGTVVWEVKSAEDQAPTVRIRSEPAGAAKWAATHLPAVADTMQTRLLPPPVPALN